MVDDMATNRKLVYAMLRPPDFEVTEAESGQEALQLLADNDYDAVLLDIMMPDMDGFQVCKAIRQELQLNLLPVFMLTTLGSPDDIVHGLDAGATDYVTKPFNAAELIARLRAATEHKRMTDRLDDTESVLFTLARMVEAKDETTGDHCDRLGHMTQVFGQALGLSAEELGFLSRGGVLHDIGKLGIPDSILLKKGPLSDGEWVIMKQHTIIGEGLCSPLQSMRGTVSIIRSHHEKWDGTGYPDGLKGKEIPLLARVFQIADIYDALASERPYKKAFPRKKVIEIMESETKKGFRDPELMAEFLQIVRTRPDDLMIQNDQIKKDRSARIFEEIKETGVLDWDNKNTSNVG